MDDLDRLLDEAQLVDRYAKNTTEDLLNKKYSAQSPNADQTIDDILNEKFETYTKFSGEKHLRKNPDKKQTFRCSITHLGGVQIPLGWSTLNNIKRACDQLKCTSCDNVIIVFENSGWRSGVDYFFLRTNYPNRINLGIKLKNLKGSRAYCCQCTSIGVTELVPLDQLPQLHWICGKHAQ
ncbi:hypothetical protein EG68_10701 [Paragonimus skrjabini miyazakii]|uniref:Cilia- and flagella-associated protein 418 n=1 Tax=Paragonimus skrjabini miyazakii TaxID=59628 RepID=A0A8S9YFC5_9TREM|nr:hypothetical protein EG68_10701 [Paragonimus skrjabini miyazakii]